jgi:prepilin-type N-terminal cleavage/methylation domain-containing protein
MMSRRFRAALAALAAVRRRGNPLPQPPPQSSSRPSPQRSPGFTLVEMIIAIAIACIVLGVTLTILVTSMNLSSKLVSDSQDQQTLNACFDYVESQLRYVAEISDPPTSFADAVAGQDALLYIGDANGQPAGRGFLYHRHAGEPPGQAALNAFGANFYGGRLAALSVEVQAKPGSRPAATVTLTLYDASGKATATQSRSLPLINAAPLDSSAPAYTDSYQSPTVLLLR